MGLRDALARIEARFRDKRPRYVTLPPIYLDRMGDPPRKLSAAEWKAWNALAARGFRFGEITLDRFEPPSADGAA